MAPNNNGRSKHSERKKRLANLRWAMFLCGLVFVGVAAGWCVHVQSNAEHIDWFGPFGDSMAPLALLATSLALFVTAYSALLQREDIDAQLEEMEASREATERLAQAEESGQLLASIKSIIDVMEQLVEHAWRRRDYLTARWEYAASRAGTKPETLKELSESRDVIEKVLKEHGSDIATASSLLSQIQLAISLSSEAIPRLKPAIRDIVQDIDKSVHRLTGFTFGSVASGGSAWARIKYTLDKALGDERLGSMELLAEIPQARIDELMAQWEALQKGPYNNERQNPADS